jgi:hypothetical protein
MLKPDGVVYFALQNGKSEEVFVEEPFKPDEKIFLNIISLDEIKNLLSCNGFKIIDKYSRLPKLKEFKFTKLFLIVKKE